MQWDQETARTIGLGSAPSAPRAQLRKGTPAGSSYIIHGETGERERLRSLTPPRTPKAKALTSPATPDSLSSSKKQSNKKNKKKKKKLKVEPVAKLKIKRQKLSHIPTVHGSQDTTTTTIKKKNRAQFVIKLFDLLNERKYSDIVSWHEDGFVIWNGARFASTVLPLLFSHQNFSSFERQMNFYSFSKMAVGDKFQSKKRMKKTEPAKWKHRLFFEGTSRQKIAGIKRSTDPCKLQEIKTSLEIVNKRNAILEKELASLEQVAKVREAELAALPPPPPEETLNSNMFDHVYVDETVDPPPDVFVDIEDVIVEYLLDSRIV